MQSTNTLHNLPAIIKTEEAASLLNVAVSTLHKWSCLETGPIRPVRIGRRLGWRVVDLHALLHGEKV